MKMREPAVIGIDLGTSACKAAVYDLHGRLLGEGSAPCRVECLRPGWVEQNPEEYWRSAVEAVRQAIAALDRQRVVALACCGHTPSLVLLDRRGRPVRPAIIWQDTRAQDEATALAEIGPEQWRQWLGMELPANASFPPARLRWLARHEPETLANTALVLQPKDYLNYRLTGIAAGDYWSSKGLAHLTTGEPVAAYAELVGLDPRAIPPCNFPHRRLGTLLPAAAAELGLPAGITVAVGWSDAMGGMLGSGALARAGLAFDLAGTSEIVGMTAEREPEETGGLLLAPVLDTPRRIVYGPTQTSGGALHWFIDRFYGGEAPERWEEVLPASAAGLVFLPYLQGERAPLWDEQARGVFFRIDLAHTREHFLRAVLEGVACSVRHVLSTAEEAIGSTAGEVRLAGGGGRLAVWNRIKASVLGTVVRPVEAGEAGTLGAAMLAALAAGEFGRVDEASAAMVRLGEPVLPGAERAAEYERLYREYRELYLRLTELF
jgi:xylulokinase